GCEGSGMDLEPWQLLALATVVLVIYGVGVELGASPSPIGLLIVGAFMIAGIVLGRVIADRFFE
ncbi:MAG: hypothetical protein ABEH66_04895, partial [Halobacteriales archaeon]